MPRILVLILVLAAACALALPEAALASGPEDRDDVRVAGRCSGASTAAMRVRADDGLLRIDLRIDTRRAGTTWRVILLHERRTAFRGTLRTGAGSRSLRLRRTVADWFGSDTIVVRATGPRGETCRASATI